MIFEQYKIFYVELRNELFTTVELKLLFLFLENIFLNFLFDILIKS